ncbi:MAG: PrsW family intramembrane metalloprotease [Phycisphaerae bacterium]|nr:PrsW family intramembrane metalloprotease [Phycisphaerae bacterium]MDW8262150.1 PrsW family intramembrane metalloprotease [Phycisphaerales bacterium]
MSTAGLALGGLGLTLAGGIFLLTLIGAGAMFGPGALRLTMVLAFLPVPFYVMLVLWLDRVEREPLWLLALAFVYGGTFATCLAGVVNSMTSHLAGPAAAAVGSAPIFEELFKGLFLLAIFLWRRQEFDGVLDGVIYASMVGLGFAAVENLEYYGRALLPDGSIHRFGTASGDAAGNPGVAAVFLVRGVLSPYLHPMFTSMTGIGFGLAAHARRAGEQALWPLGGYGLAVILHAAWNGTAMLGSAGLFVGAYVVLFVPIFLGLIWLAWLALRREERIVREHLLQDVESGLIPLRDYQVVATLRSRAADLAAARRIGGRALARARKRLHQALTELAFYRARVARGLRHRDAATEIELISAIRRIEQGMT